MGSPRVSEIKAQIKNLKSIETKKGYEFNRLRNRINNLGRSDYNWKKAIVYRNNYIKTMEKYKNFSNYNKLMEKLESVKNPLEFYDKIKNFEFESDISYQSEEWYTLSDFNNLLEAWGVETEDIQDGELYS